MFANPAKMVGELSELNIEDSSKVWALIRELLEEIHLEDYVGSRPPQKSYEKSIAESELLAFSWWSKKLERKMYIKFALKHGCYYYVSLHESHFPMHGGDEDEMSKL